jgi:hypothetical protein
LLKARSGTLGEARNGPVEEPGQTANRIAESGLQASGRARIGLNDALTTTKRMVKDKRRRDGIAAEGMLWPTR